MFSLNTVYTVFPVSRRYIFLQYVLFVRRIGKNFAKNFSFNIFHGTAFLTERKIILRNSF
ncbi:MAG TPA: hypothetical protein DCE65_04125 [Clostridiales bacterium]|nr:hypothetical protein [Clostridiales bacterium]